MVRMVIHAGFHKTGTTSAQSTIHANRALLGSRVRCFLRPDFLDLAQATRGFSAAPGPDRLAAVRRAADAFFAGCVTDDPRGILMSSEDLAGHIPGRNGIAGYAATHRLMRELARAARGRFGPDLDLVFYFSTRGREAWLRSTWWQNLRVTRLTEDFDTYATRISEASDLPATLGRVAQAIAPERLVSQPLENTGALPLGPLTPMLDLLDIDETLRRALVPTPVRNAQQTPGLDAVFLAINRSALRPKQAREAKRMLLLLSRRAERKKRETG